MDKYILEDNGPVLCNDLEKWAKWYQESNRSIAVSENKSGDIKVSTIFLGIDHSMGEGEPQLFETLIFGGEYDQKMSRFSTYKKALLGHVEACLLTGIVYIKAHIKRS